MQVRRIALVKPAFVHTDRAFCLRRDKFKLQIG